MTKNMGGRRLSTADHPLGYSPLGRPERNMTGGLGGSRWQASRNKQGLTHFFFLKRRQVKTHANREIEIFGLS